MVVNNAAALRTPSALHSSSGDGLIGVVDKFIFLDYKKYYAQSK